MRYIDTGSRDPTQALGTWLESVVQTDASVTEFRLQSGYFGSDALGYLAPALRALASGGGLTSILIGSNDGVTQQADLAALLTVTGPPRANLKIGVISFANCYFHPKTVHVTRRDGSSSAYVGSANFTAAGVAINVEAGIVLDTRDGDGKAVVDAIKGAIDWWFNGTRPGFYPVSTLADVAALASAGIIDVPPPPKPRPPSPGTSGTKGLASLRSLITLPSAAPPSGGPPLPVPRRPTTALRWTKKLSASDAQRKSTGNQRGSITLVQAGANIDPKTYFRRTMFGSASWKSGATGTGRPLETARISFDISILGRNLGVVEIEVSYAPNREAAQSNYTTLLHLGPLASQFSRTDMTGRHLTLERRSDGTFGLTIS